LSFGFNAMKTKSDYKRAMEVVGSVIHRWDPYSLLAHGCPRDEFDSEIASVVAQIPRIVSAHDAARAVSTVFSSAFQHEGFSPEDCAAVGGELFETLREHGLVGKIRSEGMPNQAIQRTRNKDARR
jgi:hypothetical protein